MRTVIRQRLASQSIYEFNTSFYRGQLIVRIEHNKPVFIVPNRGLATDFLMVTQEELEAAWGNGNSGCVKQVTGKERPPCVSYKYGMRC